MFISPICQYWDWIGQVIEIYSLCETIIFLSYTVNNMVDECPVLQGVRASVAMVLTQFYWNIWVSVPEGLIQHLGPTIDCRGPRWLINFDISIAVNFPDVKHGVFLWKSYTFFSYIILFLFYFFVAGLSAVICYLMDSSTFPYIFQGLFSDIHDNDIIMGTIGSHITNLTIVYSTVYSGADQRKHQSSVSLAFVWGIHRWPVNSLHKWPVTRKMFLFDDGIMYYDYLRAT